MPQVLNDYAKRAAEAFIAANRATDVAEAMRLRANGYKIVGLIHERRVQAKQTIIDTKVSKARP